MAHNTEMMIHGAMTEVTVLDQSADWVDFAAAAARWSHRNLLDNAYWANPDAIIDQRNGWLVVGGSNFYIDSALQNVGGTIAPQYQAVTYVNSTYCKFIYYDTEFYVSTSDCVRGYVGAGYGIDRWRIGSSGTLTVQDGYITFASNDATLRNLEQVLETLEVGKYTLSLLAENAAGTNLICGIGGNYQSVNISSNAKQVVSVTFDVTTKTSGTVYIQTGNIPIKLYAAKLELGDKQTLAHQDENGNWVLNDPPPDKGMELLKCMLYQQKIENISSGASIAGWGMVSTTKAIIFSIPLSAQLRNSTPTVIFNQAEYSYGAQYAEIPSNATISGIRNNGNSVQVVVTFPSEHGISISAVVGLRLTNSKGAYVLIDNNL